MASWTRYLVRATTLLDLLGAALLSVGAGLVYLPAGLIVAGLLVLAASWVAAGREDSS